MADAYQTLYSGQPASTGTTLIGTGSTIGAVQCIVKHIITVNTDTSDRTIQFYRNGTDAAHKWGAPMLVKANDGFIEWDGTEALSATDTLYAVASVSGKLTTTVSGDVVT